MRTEYFITMDTHCRTTDVCVKTGKGKLIRREHLSTGIRQLRDLIESVPRPRRLNVGRRNGVRLPEFQRQHCRPHRAAFPANKPEPDVCYAPDKPSRTPQSSG